MESPKNKLETHIDMFLLLVTGWPFKTNSPTVFVFKFRGVCFASTKNAAPQTSPRDRQTTQKHATQANSDTSIQGPPCHPEKRAK